MTAAELDDPVCPIDTFASLVIPVSEKFFSPVECKILLTGFTQSS
jgi:hypothetical protein